MLRERDRRWTYLGYGMLFSLKTMPFAHLGGGSGAFPRTFTGTPQTRLNTRGRVVAHGKDAMETHSPVDHNPQTQVRTAINKAYPFMEGLVLSGCSPESSEASPTAAASCVLPPCAM